jgi:general secretion pathway protein G
MNTWFERRHKAEQLAKRQRARDTKGGFTLVELLVVLVILGLVMSLVGPRVLGYLSSSRERTAHLQIESFQSALDLFYLDYGRYPTNNEGLEALVKRPSTSDHWAGPYLKQPRVPVDPWGNAYDYHVPGKTGPYLISSPGPDGKHGTSERAAIGSE